MKVQDQIHCLKIWAKVQGHNNLVLMLEGKLTPKKYLESCIKKYKIRVQEQEADVTLEKTKLAKEPTQHRKEMYEQTLDFLKRYQNELLVAELLLEEESKK